jgi:hypothetical protein
MFFSNLKQPKLILSFFVVATGSVLLLTLYAKGSIKLSQNPGARDIAEAVVNSKTDLCPNSTGTTTNCTVDNSMLEGQVLGATTYGSMELVTVHYAGNLLIPSLKVNSVTYCGEAMTNITQGKTLIGTPQSGDSMRTEMWYKSLPKSGVCPVVVTFSADPGQRVVSTRLFYNINSITPIAGATYATSISNDPATYNLTSNFNINMSMSGPKDSLLICGYSIFSNISNSIGNNVTIRPGYLSLWKFEDLKIGSSTALVWAGLGSYTQRDIDNRFDSVVWKTTKGPKWSAICTNFNVKPFGTLNPTAAPNPVTVDLKVSGTNGPVTIPYNSSVSLSWTSTLATSCTASGAWSGTKLTSGSQVIAGVIASGTYALTCNGVTDSVSVVVTPPTVDLKIGTSDGPVSVPFNGSFTLAWTTKLATSCTSSGAWTGTRALNGTLLITAVTTNRTYSLTCNGVTDSITVAVIPPTVDLKIGTSDGPVTIPYNGSFTLAWTTKGTSCTASGSWTGAMPVNGSLIVSAVTTNRTYTLTCNGGTDSISVVVTSLPLGPTKPVVDIKIVRQDSKTYALTDLMYVGVLSGQAPRLSPITLSWTTSGATSCVGLGGWSGDKALNGTFVVPTIPTASTYYALQCKNAAGNTWYDQVQVSFQITNGFVVTRTGKLFVNGFDDTITPAGSGIVGAGTQQKLYIPSGSSPVLTWSLFNETCTPSWGGTLPATSTITLPAITASKTYSLSCVLNAGGAVNTYSAGANIRL